MIHPNIIYEKEKRAKQMIKDALNRYGQVPDQIITQIQRETGLNKIWIKSEIKWFKEML